MKKIVITNHPIFWIAALVVGAVLGLLGLHWLDKTMEFVAVIYTRLFQLLAVPTIVLAVITTFATFGSKGSGRVFGRTLTYTLLTTFAAAAVGAVLICLLRLLPTMILHSSLFTLHSPIRIICSVSYRIILSNLSSKAMYFRSYCWLLPSDSDFRSCPILRTRRWS